MVQKRKRIDNMIASNVLGKYLARLCVMELSQQSVLFNYKGRCGREKPLGTDDAIETITCS